MIASLGADAVDEEESAAAYIELLTNLGELLSQNKSDLAFTLGELTRDRAELVQQNTALNNQTTIRNNGVAELDSVTQECNNADATYNDNKAGR
jgi:hypothetical protein